jgi:hypothetical protein
MVKTEGRVFATPGKTALLPQEVEIAALHQSDAGAHQANGPVAQVMRPPAWTGRNACVAEQAGRNDAVGLAGKAPVECAKRKTKAVTSLPRQPVRRTAVWASDNKTPEAPRCIGAHAEICIERDDDRGGQVTVRAADEHRGQALMSVINEPILAVDGATSECWCEGADPTGASEGFRRRREESGAWIEMCQPDDLRAVRAKLRIDREIVTPIARSATPATQADRRSLGNRADTPDFAAETPTQVRRA